jgi:hypothetical protein
VLGGGLGLGEVEHDVGDGKQRCRIVFDNEAAGRQAGLGGDVLTDHLVSQTLGTAGDA